MLPMGHLAAKQKQNQNHLQSSNRLDCPLGGQPALLSLDLNSSRWATGCITSLLGVNPNGNGPQAQSRQSGQIPALAQAQWLHLTASIQRDRLGVL